LANTRPYEGLILCLPAAFLFLRWLFHRPSNRESSGIPWKCVVFPLWAVFLFMLLFMGYYNWRLTGSAFLFPHTLNERTYESLPPFVWQKPFPEKHFNNDRFEEFFNVWEREEYTRTWKSFLDISREKLDRFRAEFYWVGLLLALPGLTFALLNH